MSGDRAEVWVAGDGKQQPSEPQTSTEAPSIQGGGDTARSAPQHRGASPSSVAGDPFTNPVPSHEGLDPLSCCPQRPAGDGMQARTGSPAGVSGSQEAPEYLRVSPQGEADFARKHTHEAPFPLTSHAHTCQLGTACREFQHIS